ncbi:hypothetical protein E2320_010561, partial [Naja naja]
WEAFPSDTFQPVKISFAPFWGEGAENRSVARNKSKGIQRTGAALLLDRFHEAASCLPPNPIPAAAAPSTVLPRLGLRSSHHQRLGNAAPRSSSMRPPPALAAPFVAFPFRRLRCHPAQASAPGPAEPLFPGSDWRSRLTTTQPARRLSASRATRRHRPAFVGAGGRKPRTGSSSSSSSSSPTPLGSSCRHFVRLPPSPRFSFGVGGSGKARPVAGGSLCWPPRQGFAEVETLKKRFGKGVQEELGGYRRPEGGLWGSDVGAGGKLEGVSGRRDWRR